MKRKVNFALAAALAAIVFAFASAGAAAAATLSFRPGKITARTAVKGSPVWNLKFEVTAANVDRDDKVVTRIYDLSFTVQADAKDMNTGKVSRVTWQGKSSQPKKLAKLDLWPGDTVKDSFNLPYTSFKGGGWRWVGEEKHRNFTLTNIKVSNIRGKYRSRRP